MSPGPRPQSPQEELIAELATKSVGGQHIFRPNRWTLGGSQQSGVREPADLVWVTNRMVFFISMKSGHNAASNKAKSKSLRQLRGGLRYWRQGNNLTGANARFDFDIPYSEDVQVVLLSVLDSDDVGIELHDSLAKDLSVAICATISERVLHRLAWRHGGSRDLIDLLIQASEDNARNADEADALLDLMHQSRYYESAFGKEPLNRTDPLSQHLVALIDALRLPSPYVSDGTRPMKRSTSPDAWDPASKLDDLGWRGYFNTLGIIHNPRALRLAISRDFPNELTWFQNDLLSGSEFFKEAGADIVVASTAAPIPPGIHPWPPNYIDHVASIDLDGSPLVLGRTMHLSGKSFQEQWKREWESACSVAEPGLPPLGIVLELWEIGISYMFVGMSGERDSATWRRVQAWISEKAEHYPS